MWQEVEITESGEGLVALPPSEQLFLRPYYGEITLPGSRQTIYLREGVAARLSQAATSLPRHLSLIVYDGLRSLELQRYLYHNYRAALRERLGDNIADSLIDNFVTAPSDNPPAPHLTGGAIDVVLGDNRGQEIDMGGFFDEMSERSRIDFYDKLSGGQEYAARRKVLLEAMTEAGFTNYPPEWWHYDYGNQFHHARVGGKAIYGYIEPL